MPPRRDELEAELGRPRANVVDAGLVVDRDQRAHGAQLPHHLRAAAGARPRGSAPRASRAARPARSPGASTGPVSMPSSTRWTVTPVVSTPAASASSIACAPGNSGSSDGWTLTIRSGKRVEERLREQVHVAGEHDELDAVLLEPGRHHEVALLAARRGSRARTSRSGSRPRARGRARSASLRFDATAAIGRPASISACRFVPLPETRTPIIAIAPDHGLAGRRLGDDGAPADPEVEDAAQLVLGDVAREPVEHGRPLPGVPVDLGARARRGGRARGCPGCRRP